MKHFSLSRFLVPSICLIALAGGSGCSSKARVEPPGTLHVVTVAKIKGLDPIYSDDLYSGEQVHHVYESLLQYHYLKRPYTLIPNLAAEMPKISADGKIFTIKLKQGVLFQDDAAFKETNGKGREMTAEDVVYSFKRLADPKLASPGWWLLDGKLIGLNEWRTAASQSGKSDYSLPVEGLKAVDRYTVELKLTDRSYQLQYALAMPFTSIVAKEAVEHYGKEFLNHPVGTGPFRLTEYNPNSRIIWSRNPTYRKEVYPSEGEPSDQEAGLLEDAGKPLPLAEQIVTNIMVEDQPRWLNFMADKIDAIAIPKDNFSSAIDSSKELKPDLKAKGVKLLKSPGLDVTHITFNMDDPIIGKNKYLRQALSMGYDEQAYIELFYNGRAIPAQGPVPPGITGYFQDLKNPYRQFNVAKAKELLAKAGYPEGKGLPPLEYATLADSTGRQTAEYFQKMMAGIGVTIKVNGYSWPQLQETIKQKKAQLWGYAWGADYPDAENFLQLFYSKNKSPGPNDANYANPQFDKLYEQALDLPDSPARTALYRKMVDLLIEDCPWIFGAHRVGYVLVQPWLKNYKPNDLDHARFKYYRVASNLKK